MPEDTTILKKIDEKIDGLHRALGDIKKKQHDVDVWVDKFTGRYTPLWMLGCFLLGLLVAEVFNRL